MKSSGPGLIWLIYLVSPSCHTKSKRLEAEQVTCSRLQDSGQSGSTLPHFSFVCTDQEPGTGYWRLVAMLPGSNRKRFNGMSRQTWNWAKNRENSLWVSKYKIHSKCFFFFFFFFTYEHFPDFKNVMIMHDQSYPGFQRIFFSYRYWWFAAKSRWRGFAANHQDRYEKNILWNPG